MITAHVDSNDLQHALKDIKKYHKDVQNGVSKEILRTAYAIVNKAKKLAPVMTGRLRSSLSVKDDVRKFEAKAGTNVLYAPYVEFGTGSLVQVPEGKEDYAMQFKGKGIRKINRRARPFLFPAAESERKNYISNIEKLLGKV